MLISLKSRSLRILKITMLAALLTGMTGAAFAGKYNLGREATKDEVAAWNIDIRPDGQGLPEGKGTVAQGEEIYRRKMCLLPW